MSKMSKLAVARSAFPIVYSGKVSHGLGRGSRQLGTPTANLAADELPLANGIYYGFARIIRTEESGGGLKQVAHSQVHEIESDSEAEVPLRASASAASGSIGHFIRRSLMPSLKTITFPANLTSVTSSSSSSSMSTGTSPSEKVSISQLYGFVACLAANQSQVLEAERLLEVHLLARFDRDFYGTVLRAAILGRLRGERSYTSVNQLIDDIHCDKRRVRALLAKEEEKGLSPDLLL